MRITRQLVAVIVLVSSGLGGRALADDYTLELVDQTGLNAADFSIYAMGFAYANDLVLGPAGTFVTQSSGTVTSYKVGTGPGEISRILLDPVKPFTGGRIYFFIAPAGTAAPTVPFSQQPTNPPNAPPPPAVPFPPYSILEITVPAATAPVPPAILPTANPATADIQTVDGFIFPLTMTLDGPTNVAGKQYGQPVYAAGQSPLVNRADIFKSYAAFMAGEGALGSAFAGLTFQPGSLAGQAGGILNPGAFLTTVNLKNEYQNLASPLNAVFDADLATLFGAATLRLSGVASGNGSSGAPIAKQNYTASIVTVAYPGTAVFLPALRFTGDTNGEVFHVFNPLGMAVLKDAAGDGIVGTITTGAAPAQSVLTLAAPVSGLSVGMYVNGAGLELDGKSSQTRIAAISGNAITLDTPNQAVGNPAANSQYSFSKLPQLTSFQTPGQMVLANSGVFADSTVQEADGSARATVLGNLENQIVSALNRGVAVDATALDPGAAGGTSAVWGDQRTWYPAGKTQNLFSLFMHVGQSSGEPIFFRPLNAAAFPNARGQVMGSAYGFAYDENGGPVGPAPAGQPEVPSKFDGNIPPGATVQVTFGPWKGAAVPSPTPVPVAAPAVKVNGKKVIRSSRNLVKIGGTAEGTRLNVKFKKKPGKVVTRRVKVRGNGRWVFKLRPKSKTTVLKFYALGEDGDRSRVRRVKVIATGE